MCSLHWEIVLLTVVDAHMIMYSFIAESLAEKDVEIQRLQQSLKVDSVCVCVHGVCVCLSVSLSVCLCLCLCGVSLCLCPCVLQ